MKVTKNNILIAFGLWAGAAALLHSIAGVSLELLIMSGTNNAALEWVNINQWPVLFGFLVLLLAYPSWKKNAVKLMLLFMLFDISLEIISYGTHGAFYLTCPLDECLGRFQYDFQVREHVLTFLGYFFALIIKRVIELGDVETKPENLLDYMVFAFSKILRGIKNWLQIDLRHSNQTGARRPMYQWAVHVWVLVCSFSAILMIINLLSQIAVPLSVLLFPDEQSENIIELVYGSIFLILCLLISWQVGKLIAAYKWVVSRIGVLVAILIIELPNLVSPLRILISDGLSSEILSMFYIPWIGSFVLYATFMVSYKRSMKS